MAGLTVFLAPPGPADGVLDALADLSGAGLVDPFLWVTEGGADGDHVATDVTRGRRSPVTVEDNLSGTHTLGRVRMCVIVPVLEGIAVVDNEAEQRLRGVLERQSGLGAKVTRVRCLLAPPGGTGRADDLARDGWHNVLIVPEDSSGPELGQKLLRDADPVAMGRYAAPVVAGVIGLWTGMPTTGLDKLPAPAGPNVRAVRSFYRRVDADAVERELRLHVLTTQPELPLPADETSSSVYLEQPGPACAKMAADLWRRHAAVLGDAPPARLRARAPNDLSWWLAIRWLWGYLLAALRWAPEEWYRRKQQQFSSVAARRVHQAVLGTNPSAYRVVVERMTANGPAGWRDLRDASDYLDRLNFDPEIPIRQEPRIDYSAVWRDYASGALTLCDAGQRVPDMQPLQVGAYRGVLRTVDECVPAPEDDFTAIPRHLATSVGVDRVQVGDVFGAETLHHQLQQAAQDPVLAPDANRVARNLEDWSRKHRPTYALQVGMTLAAAMRRRTDAIHASLRALAAAMADTEVETATEKRRRRRVAAGLVALLVAAIVVLGVVVVLGLADVLDPVAALVVGGATVAGWFVASVVTFALGQRGSVRALTQRQALLVDVDEHRAVLRQSIRDLRRLADAYGQYLFWTRLVGRFLRQPYGPPPSAEAGDVHIVRGLPRTTRIARAEVDRAAMSRAAGALRGKLYRTRWLSEPWEATLTAAPRRLEDKGFSVEPGAVFDLKGRPLERSLLEVWGTLVLQEGVEAATGDLVWGRLRDELTGSGLGIELLSLVRDVEAGNAPARKLDDFLAGIMQSHARSGQKLLNDHFTDEADTRGAPLVVIDDPGGWWVGLSGARVLVQYTDAMPSHAFKAGLPPAPFRPPEYRPSVSQPSTTNGTPVHNPPVEHPRDDYRVEGPTF